MAGTQNLLGSIISKEKTKPPIMLRLNGLYSFLERLAVEEREKGKISSKKSPMGKTIMPPINWPSRSSLSPMTQETKKSFVQGNYL